MTTLKVIPERTAQRRGVASLWASVNPVLYDGEFGVERDDSDPTKIKLKIGDGVSAWNDLGYYSPGGSAALPWDTGTTYTAGALAVGSDNTIYASLTDGNVGNDPTTDAGIHWTSGTSGGGGSSGAPYDSSNAIDAFRWTGSPTSGTPLNANTGWVAADPGFVAATYAGNVTVADDGAFTFTKPGMYLMQLTGGAGLFTTPPAVDVAFGIASPSGGMAISGENAAPSVAPNAGSVDISGALVITEADVGLPTLINSYTVTVDQAGVTADLTVVWIYLGPNLGGAGGGGVGSFDFQGLWAIGTTYLTGQQVDGSDFSLYQSLADGNVGNDPTTDAGVHWELVTPTIPLAAVVSAVFGAPLSAEYIVDALVQNLITQTSIESGDASSSPWPLSLITQDLTLTADVEFTFTGPLVAGNRFTVVLEQDVTGGHVATWDAAVFKWPGGVAPTQTPTAGAKDWYEFFSIEDGSFLGSVRGQNY